MLLRGPDAAADVGLAVAGDMVPCKGCPLLPGGPIPRSSAGRASTIGHCLEPCALRSTDKGTCGEKAVPSPLTGAHGVLPLQGLRLVL